MIDHQKSKQALKHLERQFENYRRLDQRPYLTELDREAIKESVIQRFETCYDSLWKHLKRYLVETLGLPEVPNSPKPVLRLANENQRNRLPPSPLVLAKQGDRGGSQARTPGLWLGPL